MPRIALITGTYQLDRCGIAHYTAHLRTALAEVGMESVVLTTASAAEQGKDASVQGVVRGWNLASLLPLVWAIHASEADLLHIQHAAGTYGFDRALFLLPLLLRWSGWRAPIVVTIHEYGWWEWQPAWIPAPVLEWLKTWGQRQGWWDREDGFLLTLSDAIITTNRLAEATIRERLPNLPQPVCRIPIGANVEVAPIQPDVARQQLLQRCGWTAEVKILAFFGFLHPVKGLETLLAAFQRVLNRHPQARLLLIGGIESLALTGEAATIYWQQLQQQITEMGLTSRVHLTGYLEADAASQCLAGADIGVLPFNHGVTLKSGSLLAMLAHRLPVIATRSQPPDEELESRNVVRLVSPRSVEELTIALTELLNNPDSRSRLGTAGHAFSQNFTWSSIAAAHQQVYHMVQQQQYQPQMRVLAYTDSAGIGGAEISLGHLVAHASQRIDVTVIGVEQTVVDAIADRRPGCTRIVLPARGLPSLIAHLFAFHRLHPDIVHLNLCTPWAGAIGLAAALTLPSARIVRVDQLLLRTTDAVEWWRTRFLSLRVDAHVAVGRESARRMEDFYALGRHTVLSVPNGVPDLGESLPPVHSDRQLVVGSIGRLDAMKGHDILLQAIAQLTNVRVVILGEGDRRAALEQLALELGVSDRVELLGWVSNPRKYLPKFDVVAMPSRSEGFPLAIVEAMLAARPVVATQVGSVAEAVLDGETGLLIGRDDVTGLVQALQQLRDNPDLRVRLGQRGREFALEFWTVEQMTAHYQEIWHKLLSHPRSPRLLVPRPKD